jgi:lysophospholipase L1-like esterase
MANAALAVASLVLTAGIVEIAARIARARAPESVSTRYTEPDPVRGWRHRPGARGRFGAAEYVINSHGLRDLERPLEKPPGVARVLVLGDSFAEGFSVSLDDAVARALERRLRSGDCPAEVIGGGTVGYSTDQEYLFYRDEGAAYGAGVVVLLFYYNDVLYNARGAVAAGEPKPLFTFTGGTPRVKNYPLPAPSPSPPPRLFHGSAALTWARDRLRDGAPAVYDALGRLRLWSRVPPNDVPLEMRVYERQPPETIVQAWLQTEHLLALLAREVEAHGARLLVAYVPSKMEVSARDWDRTRRRYAIDPAAFDRARVARLLADTGRRLALPVLDLTDALWDADRGAGQGPYFESGGHWNAVGHAVAARAIADVLGKGGWLGCTPRQAESARPSTNP